MKLKAVGDGIVAKRVEIESVGGIHLPSSVQAQTVVAEILSVGPDVKKIPQDFKAGFRAVFGKHAGMEYMDDKDKLLLLRDEDIMAVLTG